MPVSVVEVVRDPAGNHPHRLHPLGRHELRLEIRFLHPLVDLLHRPQHGRPQARHPVLQDIVGRAVPEGLDRGFFPHGPGNKDERDFRSPLFRDLHGGEAVEGGEFVVRQDQARHNPVECLDERLARFDAYHLAPDPLRLQGLAHEIPVERIVLQVQYLQRTRHRSPPIQRPDDTKVTAYSSRSPAAAR
jgi:hypothetical protein